MSPQTGTVFGAAAERHRDAVHLVVTTEHGRATLLFTPALAQSIGRDLRTEGMKSEDGRRAQKPPTLQRIVAASTGAPLQKPSGGI